MAGTKLMLICLLWPDDKPDEHIVEVEIDDDKTVASLKDMIKDQYAHTLSHIDAYNLVLWKCSGLPDDDNLEQTLKTLRFDNSDNRLVRLTSARKKISIHFGDGNFSNEPIHILATLSESKLSENVTRPFKRQRRYSPPLQPPLDACPRSGTVSALYERLQKYAFIQVRGTPASGKTTLALLLARYITVQDPKVKVIWLDGWPEQKVIDIGGYSAYLKGKGWVEGEETVFIFDEAQLSYWDVALWVSFFKSMRDYRDRRAIVFASYGSPSSWISIEGTPIRLADSQRVTLRPIDHKDDLPPVGLFLSRDEFDLLVSKNPHYFHSSFFDALYDLSGGHVGAIRDFLEMIASHDSYSLLKLSPQSPDQLYSVYTWDTFLKKFSPRDLMMKLNKFSTVFIRGLPEDHHLQDPATVHVFSAVLSQGVVTKSYFPSQADGDALERCFQNGWLHTDKLPEVGLPGEFGYFFTSPLHRWYVEWKLFYTVAAAIPFQAVDILKFVVDIVSKFSPRRLLSAERKIGPGCIQRPPEAQYQDEFYRSCRQCSNGSLVTFFEEFGGTAKGRVDFYIPSKQWGVELLRNGDRLSQHCGRFSKSGMYTTTTLSFSDYIILDCRTTRPTLPHPNLRKLYHVIFSDNFENVSILNNKLECIDGGEFRLS